jgi:hypothetical protein
MAKWTLFLSVALFAAAGCQQQQQVSLVDKLPEPNFGGPTFDHRPAPAMPPPVALAPSPKPAPLKPVKPAAGAVPASWIPKAPLRQWYWIVIHHSATPTGGAAAFDKMHRAKGWDELGYDFVIGNGTDTHDGQIEVGPRWTEQKWGAHDKTPGNQYNEHGIGVCLVGNFDVTHPTAAQMRSVERLVGYLMKTYHIPADHVLGHGETKATECPGRYMNVALVRRACAQMLPHTAHASAETNESAPGQELLVDGRRKK